MPRWLVVTTYLGALTLLVVVSLSLWVTLVFPAWVLVISVYILASGRVRFPDESAECRCRRSSDPARSARWAGVGSPE